jgi:hypothetical protein
LPRVSHSGRPALSLPRVTAAGVRRYFLALLRRWPRLDGRPIRIRLLHSLRAYRGKLLSGDERGVEVHAATFLRRRRIVLDTSLLDDRGELRRILAHELFHFAWVRLGNGARRSYEDLLREELRRRTAGELGWSADIRKQKLTSRDRRMRGRRWREYACESFCDTGAWLLAGMARHDEYTLDVRSRTKRRRWFRDAGLAETISI